MRVGAAFAILLPFVASVLAAPQSTAGIALPPAEYKGECFQYREKGEKWSSARQSTPVRPGSSFDKFITITVIKKSWVRTDTARIKVDMANTDGGKYRLTARKVDGQGNDQQMFKANFINHQGGVIRSYYIRTGHTCDGPSFARTSDIARVDVQIQV
jgi:hypothetical protein